MAANATETRISTPQASRLAGPAACGGEGGQRDHAGAEQGTQGQRGALQGADAAALPHGAARIPPDLHGRDPAGCHRQLPEGQATWHPSGSVGEHLGLVRLGYGDRSPP